MDETLGAYCARGGYVGVRRVGAGRVIALLPLVGERWRLIVGQEDDRVGYDDGW